MTLVIDDPADPREGARLLQVLRERLNVEEIATRLASAGLHLAVVRRAGEALGAMAYSEIRDVCWNRMLYVRDVVTLPVAQGTGIGAALLDHAKTIARRDGVACMRLCSGADRTDAHRFYRAQGAQDTSRQFVFKL